MQTQAHRYRRWRVRESWLALISGMLTALVALLPTAGVLAALEPQRIVSVNVCGDLLVLALVPTGRIASLSFLASDPTLSPLAELAKGIPANGGTAEEVLSFEPDLVLVGRHTTRSTTALLRRLGYPVLELEVPDSLDAAREQIRGVALALGVPEAGQEMIARLDERVSTARPRPGTDRPLAVLYRANGFTAGPRSLPGSLMEAAGFDNLAGRADIRHWGMLPLETLLLAKPSVLILDGDDDASPALATRMLDHPALSRLRESITVVEIPRQLWSCPGPWLAQAVERLATARKSVVGNRAR